MITTHIRNVIQREGGYVNHPADRGGPTKYGVTQKTLARHRGAWVTEQDVQDMPREEAEEIYEHTYWIQPGYDSLDISPTMEEMVLDAAIHHGTHKCTKMLQAAVNATQDGDLGPKTRASIDRLDDFQLAAYFIAERVVFFGEIVDNDHSQAVFIEGWLKRMRHLIRMISHADI